MTDLESKLLEAHRRTCGDHDASTNRCPVWNGIRAAADLAQADSELELVGLRAAVRAWMNYAEAASEGLPASRLDNLFDSAIEASAKCTWLAPRPALRTRGGSTV